MKNQLLPIQKGSNFRQLTGYVNREHLTIKPHKLIRSGHLGQLTDDDVKFLEDYGVVYNMDFRTDHEITTMPDRVLRDADYIKNPVFSEEIAKNAVRTVDITKNTIDDPKFGYKHLISCYHDIILNDHPRQAYRTFFLITYSKMIKIIKLSYITVQKVKTVQEWLLFSYYQHLILMKRLSKKRLLIN